MRDSSTMSCNISHSSRLFSWWGLTMTRTPPSHRMTPHLHSAPHTLHLFFIPDDPLKSESSAHLLAPAFRMKAALLQSLLLLLLALLGLVALGASFFPRAA